MNQAEDQTSPQVANLSPARRAVPRRTFLCRMGLGAVALAILAAFTVQKLAIEREERHLQARFGETYLDYAGRVRRWI